jgi:hypothetical protein
MSTWAGAAATLRQPLESARDTPTRVSSGKDDRILCVPYADQFKERPLSFQRRKAQCSGASFYLC